MPTSDGQTIDPQALRDCMKRVEPLSAELNEQLKQAQAFLQSLPFKRSAFVPTHTDEYGTYLVGFTRLGNSGEWGLVIGYEDEDLKADEGIQIIRNLSSMSLEQRITAARWLPEVFAQLSAQQERAVDELDSALAVLRSFNFKPSVFDDDEDIPF